MNHLIRVPEPKCDYSGSYLDMLRALLKYTVNYVDTKGKEKINYYSIYLEPPGTSLGTLRTLYL